MYSPALFIIGFDLYIFSPCCFENWAKKQIFLFKLYSRAAWMGFLASFHGGIAEEILLRLFAISLLAWLGSFIYKTSDGKSTSTIFWIANILAAVSFGLGHLPAA